MRTECQVRQDRGQRFRSDGTEDRMSVQSGPNFLLRATTESVISDDLRLDSKKIRT